jgi:DNA-binding protein H-NS
VASLQDLLAQKEALDREIESTKRKERGEAVEKIRSLMTEYGLTTGDLAARPAQKAKGGTGKKVAAKYRNNATGETWSGRGLQPKWLKAALASGRKITDFTV